MLKITIPAKELFDERTQTFIETKEQALTLEHSLISISKWEAKWCKSFLSTKVKTYEETIDYIRCMTITRDVDPTVYTRLSTSNINEISEYINAPMTATTFREDKKGGSKEIVTSELIYFWMISHNIPMECQQWHINRLLTLIRVCNVKNAPPKKRGKKDIASEYAALNAARRSQFKTKG